MLNLYTIFFNPLDAPGLYVARRVESRPGLLVVTNDSHAAPTLEAVREWVREFSITQGMLADVCHERDPDDEPQIVETWF